MSNSDLRAEIEMLRIQLAGCGVAALCNTEKSRAEQTIGKDSPYWSASYGDVLDAVAREMKYRKALLQIAALHVLTREGMIGIAKDAIGPLLGGE